MDNCAPVLAAGGKKEESPIDLVINIIVEVSCRERGWVPDLTCLLGLIIFETV